MGTRRFLREQAQVLSIPALIGLVASLFAGTHEQRLWIAGGSAAWLLLIWAGFWVIAFFRTPID